MCMLSCTASNAVSCERVGNTSQQMLKTTTFLIISCSSTNDFFLMSQFCLGKWEMLV